MVNKYRFIHSCVTVIWVHAKFNQYLCACHRMGIPCSQTDTCCHQTGIPCGWTDTLTFSPKQEITRMHRAGAVVKVTDFQLPGPQFDSHCGSLMHTFCFYFLFLKSITSRLLIKILETFYKRIQLSIHDTTRYTLHLYFVGKSY